ncbi:MAG: hypothetical protein EPO10_28840 [Reyranella sp.]|uniref:hypothetical protein n=1 Tax=Reyranella sp. TaxID=1929291 RepID=UPI0011FAF64A|nr:hypothetical protein [Reyranella sp.]TAJ97140.1 MAG: hypothetical protein EPO41_03875 [Reyranella sp.]TBR22044.1 MAG: hypothetical protein EPO10_28840 [Reyranella sp.]
MSNPNIIYPTASDTVFFGDPKFGPYRHQLMRAYKMVAEGKGQQRHGAGRAWNDQPIITISRSVGVGFPLGQALKKIEESTRMEDTAAVNELLGSIGYICAAVQVIEEGHR